MPVPVVAGSDGAPLSRPDGRPICALPRSGATASTGAVTTSTQVNTGRALAQDEDLSGKSDEVKAAGPQTSSSLAPVGDSGAADGAHQVDVNK